VRTCYAREGSTKDAGDKLAIAIHPRLAELDRLAAEAEANPPVDEEITPSETVAEPEVAPVVEAPAEAVASYPEPEEDFFLKFDKRQAYSGLRELAEREKSVKDAIETMVGRKAKAKFEPELEAARAELEATKVELRREKYAKLSSEEVSQRFAASPEFADDYAKLVHAAPVDIEQMKQAQQVATMLYQEIDRAEQVGVTPQRLGQIEDWIKSGAFDKAADGRKLTPIESYRWVRELVDGDISVHREWLAQQNQSARAPATAVAAPIEAVAAPPVEEKRAPAINPRLAEASPDLSAGSHNTSGMQRMSKQEYWNMTPPERAGRWATNADFQREVNAGLFTD